ncbi:MAG: PilZ protein [Alphaproteobacteria bacterium]|nr:PilZ protein [Alphaproteobacteria bacterium]
MTHAFAYRPANDVLPHDPVAHDPVAHDPVAPNATGHGQSTPSTVDQKASEDAAPEGATDWLECDVRRSERHSVLLSATMQCGVDNIPVRLRNISSTGARIEAAVMPPVGSIIRFIRGNLAVSARVIWAGSSNVGLEFREEINERDLLVSIGRPGAGAVKPPLKALFPCRPVSALPKPLH